MVLVSTLALLAAALPQEPPVRHVNVLPGDTVAALSLAPIEGHRDVWTATGLDRLLVDEAGVVADLRRALAVRLVGRDAQELTQIAALGQRGLSIALTPPSESGRPGFVVVVDADAAETQALSTALARRAREGTDVTRTPIGAIEAFSVRGLPQDSAIAVLEGRVVFASPRKALTDVVARTRGETRDTLESSQRYRTFLEQLDTKSELAAVAYLDVPALVAWGLAESPRDVRDRVAKWLDRVGLNALGAMGATLDVRAGEVVETLVLSTAGPRSPLLTALFPQTPVVDESIATLVPSDTAAFGVGQLRFADLYRAVFGLLGEHEPELAAQAKSMLAAIGGQIGDVDIEKELVFSLGSRIVSMEWATESGNSETVLLVELIRPEVFARALGRVPMLGRSPLAGFEMFLPKQGDGAALAIGGGRLAIASTERRLRRWIADQRQPSPSPVVTQLLRSIPADATGFGAADLGTLIRGAASGLVPAAMPLPVERVELAHRILTDASIGLGRMRYHTRADDRGLSIVATSTAGTVSRMLATFAGHAADAAATEPTIAAMMVDAQSADRNRDARRITALQAIQFAQLRRIESGEPPADLDALIAAGLVDAGLFDAAPAPGVRTIGDSLVTVLRAADPNARTFAALAWPDQRRAGDVFAIRETGPVLRNELLARTAGFDRPEPHDVFSEGKVGAAWTPGWRAVTEDGGAIVASRRGADTTTFQILSALEKKGEDGARELVAYLDHENPLIVARAVWALGRLRYTAAVPRLLDLLQHDDDVEVRRQAMGAVLAIQDPRSAHVSAKALDDDDGTVRRLAAVNVGRMHYADAKDALVSLLARPTTEGSDDGDALAAVLALRELDDPSQLLPAATAFARSGQKALDALTWLFQELSPALGRDQEPAVLMAVLDHPSTSLRRYSIQRLGELADPRAATALEGRLAQEQDQLRPLVEVSLAAIRGASGDGGGAAVGGLAATTDALLARARGLWDDEQIRTLVLSASSGLLVFVVVGSILLRRRKRRREADTWAEMTRPSQDFDPSLGRSPTPSYEDFDPGTEEVEVGTEEWAEDEAYADQEAEWQTDESTRA